MTKAVDQRGLKTVDVVYESDEIMGPAWLMFFTNTIRVSPPMAGGSGSSAKIRERQLEELRLEEDDIIDIIELSILSGIIE